MPVSQLAKLDNLDTRREVVILLQKLTPTERTAFLYWMCDRLGSVATGSKGENIHLTITNESGDCMETYLDMMQMISQYGFDANAALIELERRVSKLTNPASKRIYVPEDGLPDSPFIPRNTAPR